MYEQGQSRKGGVSERGRGLEKWAEPIVPLEVLLDVVLLLGDLLNGLGGDLEVAVDLERACGVATFSNRRRTIEKFDHFSIACASLAIVVL